MPRCSPDKMRSRVNETTEIVQGDVLDPSSLDQALQDVQTAYYLIHLMSGSKDFEKQDRQAATTFVEAAKKAGVKRIIYLGGLGDDADSKLSLIFAVATRSGTFFGIPVWKRSSSGHRW